MEVGGDDEQRHRSVLQREGKGLETADDQHFFNAPFAKRGRSKGGA